MFVFGERSDDDGDDDDDDVGMLFSTTYALSQRTISRLKLPSTDLSGGEALFSCVG